MKRYILKNESERKGVAPEKCSEYIDKLAKMINCKTVWTKDGENKAEFDRFYKTDKSRGLDKSGVGLGLYICKTLVEAHDEAISVDSRENVGTEFKFTLKKSK